MWVVTILTIIAIYRLFIYLNKNKTEIDIALLARKYLKSCNKSMSNKKYKLYFNLLDNGYEPYDVSSHYAEYSHDYFKKYSYIEIDGHFFYKIDRERIMKILYYEYEFAIRDSSKIDTINDFMRKHKFECCLKEDKKDGQMFTYVKDNRSFFDFL